MLILLTTLLTWSSRQLFNIQSVNCCLKVIKCLCILSYWIIEHWILFQFSLSWFAFCAATMLQQCSYVWLKSFHEADTRIQICCHCHCQNRLMCCFGEEDTQQPETDQNETVEHGESKLKTTIHEGEDWWSSEMCAVRLQNIKRRTLETGKNIWVKNDK